MAGVAFTSFEDALPSRDSDSENGGSPGARNSDHHYTSFPHLQEPQGGRIRQLMSVEHVGKLFLLGGLVIVLSVFERLFLKRVLDHVGQEYGLLLTHVVAILYVIGFCGYALYRKFIKSSYTPFLEAFNASPASVKVAAFTLALSDALASLFLLARHRHMPGPRFLLVLQAAVPFTVLVGYKQSFHLWHFVGAFTSFFGVLFPLGFEFQNGTFELIGTVFLLLSALCTAISGVAQDYLIRFESIDVYALHSWSAIVSLLFTACLSPLAYVLESLDRGVDMQNIFRDYPDALACILSLENTVPGNECRWNLLTIGLYIVTSFLLNISMGALVKYGSGRTLSHCLVAYIPVAYLIFSLSIPFLVDDASGLTWYGVTGCAIVVAGHYTYNSATHYQQDRDMVLALTRRTLLKSYAAPGSEDSSGEEEPDLRTTSENQSRRGYRARSNSRLTRSSSGKSGYTHANPFASDPKQIPALKLFPWKVHYTTLLSSAPLVTTLLHRLREDSPAGRPRTRSSVALSF